MCTSMLKLFLCDKKMLLKDLFFIFIIIIKNYTISLSFWKINVFVLFKIMLESC